MKWKDIRYPPKDDETVLVTNENVDMLPIKAYWDEDSEEFISVEHVASTPLSVTHWMPLPSLDSENE